MVLDKNEKWTIQNLGGCLSDRDKNIKNSIYNFKVYKGANKYINPIDKFFNIKILKFIFGMGLLPKYLLI